MIIVDFFLHNPTPIPPFDFALQGEAYNQRPSRRKGGTKTSATAPSSLHHQLLHSLVIRPTHTPMKAGTEGSEADKKPFLHPTSWMMVQGTTVAESDVSNGKGPC